MKMRISGDEKTQNQPKNSCKQKKAPYLIDDNIGKILLINELCNIIEKPRQLNLKKNPNNVENHIDSE